MNETKMMVETAPNIRVLVNTVNKLGIKREDIVSLIKESEQYILVYYN